MFAAHPGGCIEHPVVWDWSGHMTGKNHDSATNLGLEAKVWRAADALRNNIDAAEY